MEIYIKPKKKSTIVDNEIVKIKDIAEVIAPQNIISSLNNIELTRRKDKKKDFILISVLDLIKIIKSKYPDAQINNVGEMDTVVEFTDSITEKKRNNKFVGFLKIAFVTIVLIAGSCTAIMSFHTDSQLYKILEKYKEIFLNDKNASILFVEVPYSIGLAFGIIIFFNHFIGKKLTKDPTPIEVEMSMYEKDVVDTIKEVLDNKEEKKNNKEGS